jgi:lipoprotein NlpD
MTVLLVSCAGAPKSKGHYKWYTVKRGDTLFAIAWRYGLKYKRLALWNGISKPYTIYPGQQLRLYRPLVRSRLQKTGVKTATMAASSRKRSATGHQEKTYTVNRKLVKNRDNVTNSISWRWPASGKVIKSFAHASGGKKGIDIAGTPGQRVAAASAGRVVYSGSGLIGYGQLIIIKHNQTFLSAYAHNRKLYVKQGEYVKSGQKIAELGKSGTDRPKLHFEIRRHGEPVNPLIYLPKK